MQLYMHIYALWILPGVAGTPWLPRALLSPCLTLRSLRSKESWNNGAAAAPCNPQGKPRTISSSLIMLPSQSMSLRRSACHTARSDALPSSLTHARDGNTSHSVPAPQSVASAPPALGILQPATGAQPLQGRGSPLQMPQQLPLGWITQVVDADSPMAGRTFYVNTATNESHWEPPATPEPPHQPPVAAAPGAWLRQAPHSSPHSSPCGT